MELHLQFLFLYLPLLSLLYFLGRIIINKSTFSPPGPLGLPFIGNLHQINHSNLHTSLWQLSKSYGPILSLNFGFIPTIVVSSASLAKEVLKTQDVTFCSRPTLLGLSKVTYNAHDVIFSPFNKNWRMTRKIFVHHLLGPKRVPSFRHIREDEVSSAMKNIQGLALSSKHVNLSEIMKSVTSNMMLRVGFGKMYEDGHERKEVLRLINEVQVVSADFFVSDLWPGLPFAVWLIRLIDEHLNPQNLKSRDEEEDFVDILLQLKKEQIPDLTYDHIKAILMNVLVAGTDTTATTVVWAMTALITNPKVMKKAQEEVRNVVGGKGKVDEDDLPKLIYLKAVVKETLRLYPPSPLLVPRETTKETILHGYKVKPKTLVFVNALAIGRDPECWERPEEFLPERFVGSAIDFRGNDFKLIPFGGGRRICPGISMGDVMVNLLLANLIYLFDWDLMDGMRKKDIDFGVLNGITMQKRNELCLLAHVYTCK
ncbi:hypothetical protein OSB04_003538 [Centaurea solstitialis]|uniref:Cytochrome P450 n=1 Tax=Centaurea solstitialis TaxID=347529 RepID=A0AA38WNA6_9ASTR|nr:hypothetical protein OSB04_003538 [Centaurea solstitialis]